MRQSHDGRIFFIDHGMSFDIIILYCHHPLLQLLNSCINPSIYPFIHLFIHSSIHPFIHSSIRLFTHPSINLFIHPSIYSIYSSIHSSIHLSIHPFIHPSIHPFIHSATKSTQWEDPRLQASNKPTFVRNTTTISILHTSSFSICCYRKWSTLVTINRNIITSMQTYYLR